VIFLLPSELEKIQLHGSQDYPNECCGFLLGTEADDRRVVKEAWAAPNSHGENRRRRYLITPDDMLAGQKYATSKGYDILGFYHSHPDHPARPSQEDLDRATLPGWSYIILSVEHAQPKLITSWLLAEDRSKFEEEPIEICQ
jgi:proteasome lid subunit RPN8/RPN11